MVQIGFPLLDGICSLLLTMLEAAKGYFSNIVVKYNTKMKESIEPEVKTNPIGFLYEQEGEEEEDDSLL